MKRTVLLLACVFQAGCAGEPSKPAQANDAVMRRSAENYLGCLTRAADASWKIPASAEDIALAAHGRCWLQWDRYREATFQTFSTGASTREERQLARDKADAHLRQFESEARHSVVDRIVQRNLPAQHE